VIDFNNTVSFGAVFFIPRYRFEMFPVPGMDHGKRKYLRRNSHEEYVKKKKIH